MAWGTIDQRSRAKRAGRMLRAFHLVALAVAAVSVALLLLGYAVPWWLFAAIVGAVAASVLASGIYARSLLEENNRERDD